MRFYYKRELKWKKPSFIKALKKYIQKSKHNTITVFSVVASHMNNKLSKSFVWHLIITKKIRSAITALAERIHSEIEKNTTSRNRMFHFYFFKNFYFEIWALCKNITKVLCFQLKKNTKIFFAKYNNIFYYKKS